MRRLGFTLVEVIVVISIIAVLVAILAPALRKSRLQAKAAVCTSNVRQLNLALYAYAADNQRFPYGFDNISGTAPADGYAGGHQYDRMGWWWFNYLEGFYEKTMKRSILDCPAKQIHHSDLKEDILCGNYGVNLSICRMSTGKSSQAEFTGEPRAIVEITRPSSTLLLVDAGYAIISWWHAADNPPMSLGDSMIEDTAYVPGLSINEDRLLWPGQRYDALFGRHPNKTVNVGFVDGHVARTEAEDLLVSEDTPGYRNLVPLWCPE